jgi:hypothetical protein
MVKKAVAAYETGETDGHIGIRGVTLPVGLIYRIRRIGVEANLTTATYLSAHGFSTLPNDERDNG